MAQISNLVAVLAIRLRWAFLSSLKEIGLELGRLKTGTPPRLLRRSIDFSKTEIQLGDEPVPYFTYWKDDLFHMEQFARECRQRMTNQAKISTWINSWKVKWSITLFYNIYD